jgi:hypothetical protein
LPEDFGRRFVAEAFARRCIQAVANVGEIAVALRDRRLTSIENHFRARPLVLLNSAFLTGRLRIAKPSLRSCACLHVGPVGEFGATVEGDRAAAGWCRDWDTWISPSINGLDYRSLLRRTTENRL